MEENEKRDWENSINEIAEKARKYWKAGDTKNALKFMETLIELGDRWRECTEGDPEQRRAMYCYGRASYAGYALGALRMGELFEKKGNNFVASRWYKRAVDKDCERNSEFSTEAMVRLGKILYNTKEDNTLQRHPMRAKGYLECAAKRGSKVAEEYLAQYFPDTSDSEEEEQNLYWVENDLVDYVHRILKQSSYRCDVISDVGETGSMVYANCSRSTFNLIYGQAQMEKFLEKAEK